MPVFVDVALPVPGLDFLTYRVPEDLGSALPGVRVLVPLGARRVTGCVVGVSREPPDGASAGRFKDVVDVLDATPFLPADVLELTRWVAEYYAAGLGEAIRSAMPPLAGVESRRMVSLTEKGRYALESGTPPSVVDVLRVFESTPKLPLRTLGSRLARDRQRPPSAGGASPTSARGLHALVTRLESQGFLMVENQLTGRASAFRTERVARITALGLDQPGFPNEPDRRGRQREALAILTASPDGIPLRELRARGISPDVVRRLAGRGLVAVRRETVERDPFAPAVGGPSGEQILLSPEQSAALARLWCLANVGGFRAALLHGVTGSGKTEIYLRLARALRDQGRQSLVLVPEIALTPAVAALFRLTFGERVAVQHSGLSDGERHDQWQRIRRGGVDVVVGTRSAVFAPVPAVGLIIVDEEHDASYKQEESPRYHGRDVAVMRARQAGALVVLGSATPSLESYQNAEQGRYERVSLPHRILDRPLASVRIVNMRDEYADRGPDVILSGALREALGQRLIRGEQALVLLNRRGFAAAVFCRQCTATLDCPNCSVTLTVHLRARRARCHYCNFSMAIPGTCARCAGPFLEQAGYGTERVEAVLLEEFPAARIARLDRDTAGRRGSAAALLERFARHELDVLVGTQMIAKGHDFPKVTLVGVISADVGLGLADFRAAERTFQLLTQVVGRAGRGVDPGEAVVQTLFPDHYSVRYGCLQDYERFYEEEIRFRRAMRYPPAVALVNTVVRAADREVAMEDAARIVNRLRHAPGLRVLGPAPAPLQRLKGEYRVQFFIKGTHRTAMRGRLEGVLADEPELRKRVTVDVDPLSVL
jgi:primosomal protein N' (replication factor Y)